MAASPVAERRYSFWMNSRTSVRKVAFFGRVGESHGLTSGRYSNAHVRVLPPWFVNGMALRAERNERTVYSVAGERCARRGAPP